MGCLRGERGSGEGKGGGGGKVGKSEGGKVGKSEGGKERGREKWRTDWFIAACMHRTIPHTISYRERDQNTTICIIHVYLSIYPYIHECVHESGDEVVDCSWDSRGG